MQYNQNQMLTKMLAG